MQEFGVGDWVWCARLKREQVDVPCPVCFTKKEVTVRLGNGDEVVVDCDYCSRGYVSEYVEDGAPERYLITAKTVTEMSEGKRTGYHSHHYYFEDTGDLLFATESEAMARGLELAREKKVKEETKSEYLKKNNLKSYAWNAGYHIRNARDHEKQAAYHHEKARLCKIKAKSVNDVEAMS
jgi:hypothetical protein